MGILSKGMQGFLVFIGACFLSAGNAYAGNEALASSYDFVSDGERIDLREGDISIVPPAGWEVFTKHPSLTLLMQVPHEPTLKYQRTIQVASFGGKKYIDEVTAREFEGIIVRKFSQLTSSIEDYKIREHQVVDMSDGRDGILIYSEFQLEGVSMMQAHILVSSEKRHYLMTFTDLADHFEKEEYSQYLNEAWSSMVSVELAGGGGATLLKKLGLSKFKRFQSLIYLSLGAVGLGLLLLIFKLIRKSMSGNRFSAYMGDGGRDDDEMTGHGTMHSQMQSQHQSSSGSRSKGTSHSSQQATLNHSQPARTGSVPAQSLAAKTSAAAPLTKGPQHESRLGTAESTMEDAEMDTFFGVDDDEDDKAI